MSSGDKESENDKVKFSASEQSSDASQQAGDVKPDNSASERPVYSPYTASNGCQVMVPFHGYKDIAEKILDLEMRSDDVIVSTFPKAGTTWMQEIVWLICNNADVDAANKTQIRYRYNFMETPGYPTINGLQSFEAWPTDKRRFVKTHLPFELLPYEVQNDSKCKIVYLARNPKDLCVSYYHFHRMTGLMPEPGTWSEFLSKFCSGEHSWGAWHPHVLKYWEMHQKRKDSIHFVTYEQLQKDLPGEVAKIAKFLKKYLSEEQIDVIARHCTFNSMSNNWSTNFKDVKSMFDFKVSKFLRKGEVGDWKNHFTINQNIAFDKWYEENTKDWPIKFEFE